MVGTCSSADLGCIKCNVKAMQGELHFLEKSMLFVAKTPILVDYGKITKASISRCVQPRPPGREVPE